jgi:membrane protein
MLSPAMSFRIVYRAAMKWSENGGMRLGAALAYYMLFSIAPLLLIAIRIAGAVFDQDAAKGNVRHQIERIVGNETVATTVEKMVEQAPSLDSTGWTPVVSAIFLIIAALSAFLHVRGALCTIWKLEPPHGNSWLGMIWDYVLSLLMVFVIAVMLLISLACSLAVPILQNTMERTHLDVRPYWQWIELAASFVFLTLLFAMIYWVLSGGRISFGYVLYGAIIAAVLFTFGKTALSYYIVFSVKESVYGAAGSMVVFLVWVFYSSQTLFFGAELIQARRTRHEWMNDNKPPPVVG